MENKELDSPQVLSLLRFPLAIFVVMEHLLVGMGDVSFSQFMNAYIREQSVPIYFFISGYFFFYNVEFNKNIYVCKLRNRINTLLIPYLIWNTIAIIGLSGYNYFLEYLIPYAAKNIHLSFGNILSCYGYYNHLLTNDTPIYTTCPIDTPLWFLRTLMITVLCSPILYKLLKVSKKIIFLLGLCWMMLRQWYQENFFCDVFYQFALGFFFFHGGGIIACTR